MPCGATNQRKRYQQIRDAKLPRQTR